MTSMLSACGMGGGSMHGPVLAAMAAMAGFSALLWLALLVLAVLGIVWLVSGLRSKSEPPGGDAPAPARS
jgi:hypothetical protein